MACPHHHWVAAFLVLTAAAPSPALAWGSKGHRIIGELAAQNFPAAIPAFLRTPEAIAAIGELAREPDRSRDAGQPHDNDSDPGHFVDVMDNGTILGGPLLARLPPSRQDYDTALRALGTTEYKAGWLPYSVMDGWQQLVKDFVLWRADVAGVKSVKNTAADQKWLLQDRRLRETLTLRDLGVWAHYVGDASQPLHVSVHYNGWGNFPNPEAFANAPNIHARFETQFVDKNINETDVAARLRPYRACTCAVAAHVATYLAATQGEVLMVYRLDKAGAFDGATPEAKAFVAARLAEGAAMLRDLVVDAWEASATSRLGYNPTVPLADIEAGKVDPLPLLRD
jgi:hypothetical protein